MQSAENGFKKHHLIPFSQKIQRRLLLPPLQEKNNCLAPSPLWRKKSVSCTCTLHTCAFMAKNEFLQKKEMNTQLAKMVSECTICIRFSKIFSGSPPPPHTHTVTHTKREGYSLTHLHRRTAPRLVYNPLQQCTKFLDPSLTMQCIFWIQFY